MPPERMCIACRSKAEQRSFFRIRSRSAEESGRSAYVCRTSQCVAAACQGTRFSRAFRRAVAPEELARIRETLACQLN